MPESQGIGGEVPVSNRFLFEVDGVEIGRFTEVSGLELDVEVVTYNEGGENGFVHQFPGQMTWPNIVLKRGVTKSDALFDWVKKSSGQGFASNDNKLTRCTGAITALGTGVERLRSWNILEAFPVRWVGPKLDVNDKIPLYEEIEVAHHGFTSKTTTNA